MAYAEEHVGLHPHRLSRPHRRWPLGGPVRGGRGPGVDGVAALHEPGVRAAAAHPRRRCSTGSGRCRTGWCGRWTGAGFARSRRPSPPPMSGPWRRSWSAARGVVFGRPAGREGPGDRRGGPGAVRGGVHPPGADPGQGRGVDRPVRGAERAGAGRGGAQGDPDTTRRWPPANPRRGWPGRPRWPPGPAGPGPGGPVGGQRWRRWPTRPRPPAMTGHPDRVAGLRLDPTVPEQRRALLAAAVADVQHEYATWTVGQPGRGDRPPGRPAAGRRPRGQARPLYLEALAREAVEPGNALWGGVVDRAGPGRGPGGAAPPAGRPLDLPAAPAMSVTPPWTSWPPRNASSPRPAS